ncbi:MAG TPA: hypothetical protein VKH83_10115 [Methylomirabilota bacterium]|nr:hypothetical protein [Methylomirabilota bacterium]
MAALLLLLITLAVPLEVSQPIHLHDAGTVGLYNEEHVLASLDSVSGDLPLPDAPTTHVVVHVASAGRITDFRLPASVASFTDSRAPPAAS